MESATRWSWRLRPGGALYTHLAPVQRLNDPVYRHRLLQFLADAVVAAQPFSADIPRSVVVMDFLICLLLAFGARMVGRLVAERPSRAARRRKGRETLVVGAGSGGQMVVREMLLNPNLGSKAVGFVDDDPRKRGMRLLGLKVLGSTDEI